MRFWRYLLTLAVLCLGLSGCQRNPQPEPTATPAPTPVQISLRQPGMARTVVNALLFEADSPLLIRLTLTETKATIFYVEDDQAKALSWVDGVIQNFDTDVEYLDQALFDARDFTFDDLDALFSLAAEVSGTDSGQELQINELNDENVLMSVSTSPESVSVFFRPDGSLIRQLDFTLVDDFTEGLADVLQRGQYVTGIGYSPNLGMWSDALVEPGVVERWTRPAKLPAFSSRRSILIAPDTFLASSVEPAVIVQLMQTLPNRFALPSNTPVSFTITVAATSGQPRITFDVGGNTVITDLAGQVLPAS